MENIEALELLVLGSRKHTSLIAPRLKRTYIKNKDNTRKCVLIPNVKILNY